MVKKRVSGEDPFLGLQVKPEAVIPLRLLLDKMAELEENGIYKKCGEDYYNYTEREDLTEDECEELCHGCPLLKLCYDYAVADEVVAGVWGGVDFLPKDDTLFELGDEEEYNDC